MPQASTAEETGCTLATQQRRAVCLGVFGTSFAFVSAGSGQWPSGYSRASRKLLPPQTPVNSLKPGTGIKCERTLAAPGKRFPGASSVRSRNPR